MVGVYQRNGETEGSSMSWLTIVFALMFSWGIGVSMASGSLIRERTVTVDEKMYVVEYTVDDTGSVFIPLTNPPGQAHYPAAIRVFVVADGHKQAVGSVFDGQYTFGGCFEDDPAMLVRKALKQ